MQYKVGSILNVNGHALSVDKWHEIIGAIQNASMKTRLKIPNIYGIDSIHGANYVRGATLVSAGNRDGGDLESAVDAKGGGNYGDGNSRRRNPLEFFAGFGCRATAAEWARFWETFGEDTYLAKVMGASFVRGLEGNDVSVQTRTLPSSLKALRRLQFSA